MILVTGAAGKTGRAVSRALLAKDQSVRVLVRRTEQAATLKELGVGEAVVGDMQDAATFERAAQGARAIYHICPNMHPEEVAIGEVALHAAQSNGVEHFVYHSVLRPQIESMPHHWCKSRVEEKLFESGLRCTTLQPAPYMQNVLSAWDHIVEEGRYPVPYRAESVLSMVDLEEVAEVAAIVLTEPGHNGATYELCAPEALSQTEIAAALQRVLGREVCAVKVPLDEWQRQAGDAGLDDYTVETLAKMFRYYDRHGLRANSRVLEWLLGRSPVTLEGFVARWARQSN